MAREAIGPHLSTAPLAPPDPTRPGPLAGLRVIELAGEYAAFCGRFLADFGAEVILVEPPGGAPQRWYEPFVDDVVDPERSLWFWHYHANKFGVQLDLDSAEGRERFRELVASADIVVESEAPGRLAALGVDDADLRATQPGLIWAAVTAFGRTNSRAHEPATDLTVLANAGPVWSCGYDDHTIPPVRGGGNQAYHTASVHAAIGILVAALHRDVTGRGQFIDVSVHAASNVTTEFASYGWLVAQETVQRQTCRHASAHPTQVTVACSADGRYQPTGVPPRAAREFRILIDWVDDLGWRDEIPDVTLLELGEERGGVDMSEMFEDDLVAEIFRAGRDVLVAIATRVTAYEFFVQGQRRGMALPVIFAPEEVLEDEHFRARGFPVTLDHADLGRPVTYAGAPFVMDESPWHLRRHAPRLGEHDDLLSGS
ncbi:MAG: carnitine dehydratase [Actinobacteria bacterium]|nr:carnitine dehydratase [Actinomycetota bacterium]